MKLLPFDAGHAAAALPLLNLLRREPLTLAGFHAREARWPVAELRLRWLGLEGGRAVAFGQLAASPFLPADHAAVAVAVAAGARGRGRGGMMLGRLEREAARRGFRGLAATLPETEPGPLAWAEARGFRQHARRCDSLLDLRGFGGGAEAPTGAALADMTGADPAEWLEVAALLRSLVADAPDMRGLPPWSLPRCLSLLREAPARPDWVIVARSGGAPVGLTVGHAMGAEIYSFFTGVVPAWRGRRLGFALKGRLIAAAREGGVVTMRTTNLDGNAPALRLNAALGFRPAPGSVELRKPLPPEGAGECGGWAPGTGRD